MTKSSKGRGVVSRSRSLEHLVVETPLNGNLGAANTFPLDIKQQHDVESPCKKLSGVPFASNSKEDRVSPTSILDFLEIDDAEYHDHTSFEIIERLKHPLVVEQQEAVAPIVNLLVDEVVEDIYDEEFPPSNGNPVLEESKEEEVEVTSSQFNESYDRFNEEETSSGVLRWKYVKAADGVVSVHPSFSVEQEEDNNIMLRRSRSCATATNTAEELTQPQLRRAHSSSPCKDKQNNKSVAFNETMQVRYFSRTDEEIVNMRECAFQRRLQRRRRREAKRASLLQMAEDEEEEDDDDYDSVPRFLPSCGVPNAFAGTHHHRRRPPSPPKRVFQDVVNDLSTMITDVIVDVKKSHERLKSDQEFFAELEKTEINDEEEAALESSNSLLEPPPSGNFNISADYGQDDSWLCSALRCGRLEE